MRAPLTGHDCTRGHSGSNIQTCVFFLKPSVGLSTQLTICLTQEIVKIFSFFFFFGLCVLFKTLSWLLLS